ncbi:transmembrane protein, putative (macronuclear) [Tetrahymena thermophila SB210]|uniref:Transmembrane protein, putative n=1 Tax=Tetrahymena thermophila (strain SB210) TaxID=312017 RepID=I7MLK7_TETTS|nr:transmembrane protein, putative [Tetrahymena thermophila SB210]EAS02607.4 transmembrane protein, putative [Tetrahymena thermophila SB210]|eukprot:XP_001022852.4 transmembrane protein, putative [Tetrahymena thermophila SB210]
MTNMDYKHMIQLNFIKFSKQQNLVKKILQNLVQKCDKILIRYIGFFLIILKDLACYLFILQQILKRKFKFQFQKEVSKKNFLEKEEQIIQMEEEEIIQFRRVKCCMCDQIHFQCYICFSRKINVVCDYVLKTQNINYCKRCETYNLFCQNLIQNNICFISLQNLFQIYYDNMVGNQAQQMQNEFCYQTYQENQIQQQYYPQDLYQQQQYKQLQTENILQITKENNQNFVQQNSEIYKNIEEQDTILDEEINADQQSTTNQVLQPDDLDESFILSSISLVGAIGDVNQNQNQNNLEEWNNYFDFNNLSFMKNENSLHDEMNRLQFEIQIDLSQLNITQS